jgi:hypothetical protein
MVTSYLEAYTKASKTKPGSGHSISSMSTATSALHSVPDASRTEQTAQHRRDADHSHGELGKWNPEDFTELPTAEAIPKVDCSQPEWTPEDPIWSSVESIPPKVDCSHPGPEETSSGEFAFLEVPPDDFTVLHDVTFESMSWQLPTPRTEPANSQDTFRLDKISLLKLPPPLGCEEKSARGLAPLQHASSFHIGRDSLPVRNTFIHIQGSEEEVQREWSSCPGMIMAKEFSTKYPAMEQTHIKGDCRPCAYFIHKGDGCRWGEECRFCHLCPPGALKKKKKDKVKALKQRDYFAKLASMQTNDAS